MVAKRLFFYSSFIGELEKLRVLNLAENHLQKLPLSITKLKNLEEIDVSWNFELEDIPRQILRMPNLNIINETPEEDEFESEY